MTDLTAAFPARPALPALLDQMFRDAPLLTRLGLFLTASLAVTLLAAALDPRQFQGINVWIKPVKFQLSLALYTLTLAAYARWLPPALGQNAAWRAYTAVVALCILAELAWIGGAAANGTGSHFNTATPLMAALYPLMGLAAVTLTTLSLAFGIAIARNPATGLSPALRTGLALGLVLTFVLTVPVAGYMAGTPGHLVGTPVTGATLWPMGWSREVGDLRVAHFFATHAMQVIPAAALVAAWLLPDAAARPAVIAISLAFTALVAFTFWQAVAGRPFLA